MSYIKILRSIYFNRCRVCNVRSCLIYRCRNVNIKSPWKCRKIAIFVKSIETIFSHFDSNENNTIFDHNALFFLEIDIYLYLALNSILWSKYEYDFSRYDRTSRELFVILYGHKFCFGADVWYRSICVRSVSFLLAPIIWGYATCFQR